MTAKHNIDEIPVLNKVALSEDGQFLYFIPSVAILGLFDDGQILLIEQYRPVVDKNTVELPGGKIEEGEDIILAARRELLEESGYSAESFELIFSLDMDLSASRHITHVVWAKLRDHIGHEEKTRVIILELDQAIEMIVQGEITHAPTVAALLWLNGKSDRV